MNKSMFTFGFTMFVYSEKCINFTKCLIFCDLTLNSLNFQTTFSLYYFRTKTIWREREK